jgi:hypothetical protein
MDLIQRKLNKSEWISIEVHSERFSFLCFKSIVGDNMVNLTLSLNKLLNSIFFKIEIK